MTTMNMNQKRWQMIVHVKDLMQKNPPQNQYKDIVI